MEHLKASLTDKVIMVEFVEHSDTGSFKRAFILARIGLLLLCLL